MCSTALHAHCHPLSLESSAESLHEVAVEGNWGLFCVWCGTCTNGARTVVQLRWGMCSVDRRAARRDDDTRTGWRGGGARGARRERAKDYALEAMLGEAERRKRGRQELLERVEADTSEEMDNGVRINPSDAEG